VFYPGAALVWVKYPETCSEVFECTAASPNDALERMRPASMMSDLSA
jgi:hypothetical protein